MEFIEYQEAQAFLKVAQPVLEKKEACYGLMLGISLMLVDDPFHFGSKPFLSTVVDGDEVQLIALMTPPYKLQIATFCMDPGKAIKILVENIHKGDWTIPAVFAEEEVAKCFEAEWLQLAECKSEQGMRQRIYQLLRVNNNANSKGFFRQGTDKDLNCASTWIAAFHDDCFGKTVSKEHVKTAQMMIENGDLYFWENDLPVSMAGLTRPTKHGVSVSYVYTPLEFRNKGYATALVTFLSEHVLAKGKSFCTLYTDLSNQTSNSIYQKIGYSAIADVMDVNFIYDHG